MATQFAAFIQRNGLQSVQSVLLEHDIVSINALRGCTAEDFREIGLRVGPIGKIRVGLEELMKTKRVGGSQRGRKKAPTAAAAAAAAKKRPAAAKKRPAAAQTHVSRKRPSAAQEHVSKKPSAAGAVALPAACLPQLPSTCLMMILDFAYMGAVDSIEMSLFVDGRLYDGFSPELEHSKVPKQLHGRVLQHGHVLLCSGQLPLVNRAKGVSKSLGISKDDLERGSPSACGAFLLFREKGKYLQARWLYHEDAAQSMRFLWEDPRWKTIGTILKVPNPLAALSRDLFQHLRCVAPCNYRYAMNRPTEVEGMDEFDDDPRVDLVVVL
eukprot:CAMPEP_0113818220 /NCGR_PEP_ID=MMETSP0328-20130328/131_1 /TAXON_ID=39455 /ORGANISM="Alexandrium minutum" /LENGTH=324 /DNA_ID=CAMNT_0000786155 /DNA_START=153 /DNA_END=1127 /DNA_ORIENTATION=- /assembly_acc=CAM_ASM_000350